MNIEFDQTEGWPYAATITAAARCETPEQMSQAMQGYWPTMDYMVENGRFGRAVGHVRALTALCYPLGRPKSEA